MENAKTTLDRIVKECIEQHEGGEPFFDALDGNIRTANEIMGSLEDIAIDIFNAGEIPRQRPYSVIVTSGKFGAIFAVQTKNRYESIAVFDEVIPVEGSLRKNDFTGFGSYDDFISKSDVIFIDDSFYLGRTRDKIKAEVESLGGNFMATVVAYDGSTAPMENNVFSIVRYHPITGAK